MYTYIVRFKKRDTIL